MIVIYHDVGGCHSSATAANIHIGKLPADKNPTKSELLSMPTFDNISKNEKGKLLFIGTDEFGAQVYTLSRKYHPELVIPSITDMYKLTSGSLDGLFLSDTSPSVNNLMRVGGFSSRRLGLVKLGRPIVTQGTLNAYPQIIKIVNKTKEYIRKSITIPL
ncbi:MAG: DUF3189 family protein [Clostridiaceae bacterium]|nr:DUF3189 family protein [Clostridiaceae bacterium]